MDVGIEGTISFQIRLTSQADLSTVQRAYEILEGRGLLKQPRRLQSSITDKTESVARIIDILKRDYGSSPQFTTAQANVLVSRELRLKRSSTQNALGYGVKNAVLKKLKQGVFSFQPGASVGKAMIDIRTDRIAEVVQALTLAEKVSPVTYLFMTKNALVCRSSDEKTAVLIDIKVERELFSSFKVDRPLSIAVDSKALLERLRKQKQFWLVIESLDTQVLKIGEYSVKLGHIEELQQEPDPLEIKNPKGIISIDRQELEDILQRASANANYVDLMYSKDRIVFSNVSLGGDDWSHEVTRGYESREQGRTRYIISFLLKAIKAVDCKSLNIQDDTRSLFVNFLLAEEVTVQLIVGAVSIAPKVS
ncbi:MAG: hypothetical protein ACREBU_08555 [Nitrososphaera sp.]